MKSLHGLRRRHHPSRWRREALHPVLREAARRGHEDQRGRVQAKAQGAGTDAPHAPLRLLRPDVRPDEDPHAAVSRVLVGLGRHAGALARHGSIGTMKDVTRIYVAGAEQLDPDLMNEWSRFEETPGYDVPYVIASVADEWKRQRDEPAGHRGGNAGTRRRWSRRRQRKPDRAQPETPRTMVCGHRQVQGPRPRQAWKARRPTRTTARRLRAYRRPNCGGTAVRRNGLELCSRPH